jgi:hypothetical protein
MTADDITLAAFEAGDVALPVPSEWPGSGAMAAMAHYLAGLARGYTPEDMVGFLDSGWPEDVAALLAEPFEADEMRAHVNVLLHLAERG